MHSHERLPVFQFSRNVTDNKRRDVSPFCRSGGNEKDFTRAVNRANDIGHSRPTVPGSSIAMAFSTEHSTRQPRNYRRCRKNYLARVVLQRRKFCHAQPLLKSLHWFPISQRINFKLATLAFKIQSTSQPCLLYTSPSPRDRTRSRMPSSA